MFCGLRSGRLGQDKPPVEIGILKRLAEQRLLASVEIATTETGYDSIYRLSTPRRTSYVYEWSPSMWKAAAVLLIRLLQELRGWNLTLYNPHLWNVMFERGEAVYIDVGSIVRFDSKAFVGAYEKLCCFLLRPLLMNAAGRYSVARQMVCGMNLGVRSEDFPEVTGFTGELTTSHWEDDGFLYSLLKATADIEVPAKGKWTGYHGASVHDFTATPTAKQQIVCRVLSELRPHSVLDLGCNEGKFSLLAETHGREVIGADADEICVNSLHQAVRAQRANIATVVMDFTNPAPGYGVCNRWFAPATERFAADMVLGLAIEHHLVFGRYRLTFDEIVRGFAAFCRKWLLIEFVQPGAETNANPAKWRPESVGWYNCETFIRALQREFSTIVPLSPPAADRQLLLCTR